MKDINVEKLKEEIARPQIRDYLTPLLLFKGNMTPHQAQSRWNFVTAMMLAEVGFIGDGVKLSQTDVLHLCGSHAKSWQHTGMMGFLSRMRLNPRVTNIVPGLTEYVGWICPRPWELHRIPLVATSAENCKVPWRRVERKVKKWELKEDRTEIQYPYVRSIPNGDHELLMAIHKAVPHSVPHNIRSDLCQDLLVAVLSGETTVENIPDVIGSYRKQANKFNTEGAWRVSLDAHICGFDDLTHGDRVSGTDEHF